MPETLLCTQCLSRVYPQTVTPGNIFFELILWLLFILPGLLYSIWRLSARRRVCPFCGATAMIPLNSPRAQQLLADRPVG